MHMDAQYGIFLFRSNPVDFLLFSRAVTTAVIQFWILDDQ